MNELIINCDGGSRGNPGPAASAFVVKKGNEEIYHDSKFLGNTTNNVAEYSAVILALEWLLHDSKFLIPDSVVFILDSELIVRQINGVYKVKDLKLKKLHAHVAELIKKLGKKIIFKNVLRDKNKIADGLVNIKLDKLP